MPGYIQKALLQFKHQAPKAKQNSPHPHVKPQYRAIAQYATNEDTSPPPHRQEGKICERSSRDINLLCQMDSTILPALSAIATEQANPMEKTIAIINQLLDYCAMQDKVVLA
jgi:hypothetical protein